MNENLDAEARANRGLSGAELVTLLLLINLESGLFKDGLLDGQPFGDDTKPQERLARLSEVFRAQRQRQEFGELLQFTRQQAEFMERLGIRLTSSDNAFLRKLVKAALVRPAEVDTELCKDLGIPAGDVQQGD